MSRILFSTIFVFYALGNLFEKELPLSYDEKEYLLDMHNEMRSKVARGLTKIDFPRATNMRKLVWDSELASTSLTHAKRCLWRHSNDMFLQNGSLYDRHYTENIYRDFRPDNFLENAMYSWYSSVITISITDMMTANR